MKLAVFLALTCAVAVFGADKARYDNYKVHTVVPKTDAQLAALEFMSGVEGYDFWSAIKGLNAKVDVMVPPHMAARFSEFLENNNMESSIMIADVQSAIEKQNPKISHRNTRAIDWESYFEIDEVSYN